MNEGGDGCRVELFHSKKAGSRSYVRAENSRSERFVMMKVARIPIRSYAIFAMVRRGLCTLPAIIECATSMQRALARTGITARVIGETELVEWFEKGSR